MALSTDKALTTAQEAHDYNKSNMRTGIMICDK